MAKEEDLQAALAQMQLLQQRAQVFASQKQQFQIQLMEAENALKELKSTKSPVYRMIGGILIEKSASDIKKELIKTKDDLNLQIKTIEKQEEKTQKQATEMQQKLSKQIK